MYVNMYKHTHIYIYITYLSIYIKYVCTHVQAHIHTHTHTYILFICTYTYNMYVYMYKYIYVLFIYLFILVHTICMCTCRSVCTHKHADTELGCRGYMKFVWWLQPVDCLKLNNEHSRSVTEGALFRWSFKCDINLASGIPSTYKTSTQL